MKKEDYLKLNQVKDVKNYHDQRSRSHSPKAYHGCDTCKLKNGDLKKIKSISKFSDYACHLEKDKVTKFKKISSQERDKSQKDPKMGKIKLTDLCDDDKKRIVELIEELSKFAEKNQKLKEILNRMQKTRQEQQDYIMKQANLHLEEKNFYVNEINEYKCKLESVENDLKNKVLQWEKHERFMDTEMAYFAKALQESMSEKNDLNEQMSHLKNCLRQSLDAFQRLRNDITALQEKAVKRLKSVSCQTEAKSVTFKEKYDGSEDELDEELFSLSNQNSMEAKSSLDVINDKLEYVYQLLKRKSEHLGGQSSPKKFDADVYSVFLADEKLPEDKKLINSCQDEMVIDGGEEQGFATNACSKPFAYCSKTSIQAERILKKIGEPLNLSNEKLIYSPRETIFEGDEKLIQQNNLFRCGDDLQCNEDRLLQDLFYADGNLKLGL